MRVDATPPVADDELEALRAALARAGLLIDGGPPLHGSEWLRSARREAVEAEPGESPAYALSPRKTRGATRA